jgi:hypothetical protein
MLIPSGLQRRQSHLLQEHQCLYFKPAKFFWSQNSDLQSSAFNEAQFYLQITHLYVNLQLTFVSSVKNLILGVCGGKWFYSALNVDQQHLQALEAL